MFKISTRRLSRAFATRRCLLTPVSRGPRRLGLFLGCGIAFPMGATSISEMWQCVNCLSNGTIVIYQHIWPEECSHAPSRLFESFQLAQRHHQFYVLKHRTLGTCPLWILSEPRTFGKLINDCFNVVFCDAWNYIVVDFVLDLKNILIYWFLCTLYWVSLLSLAILRHRKLLKHFRYHKHVFNGFL